jgi:hypothetical protein
MKIDDLDGSEFANLAEARREAIAAIRDMLAEEIKRTGECRLQDRWIEISDEAGQVCDTVQFREALGLVAN